MRDSRLVHQTLGLLDNAFGESHGGVWDLWVREEGGMMRAGGVCGGLAWLRTSFVMFALAITQTVVDVWV
jgi:hypothetical protein